MNVTNVYHNDDLINMDRLGVRPIVESSSARVKVEDHSFVC